MTSRTLTAKTRKRRPQLLLLQLVKLNLKLLPTLWMPQLPQMVLPQIKALMPFNPKKELLTLWMLLLAPLQQ